MGSTDRSSQNHDVLCPEELNQLSTTDVIRKTKDLQKSMKRLWIENEIFERFLRDKNLYNPESFTRLVLKKQHEDVSVTSTNLSSKQSSLQGSHTTIQSGIQECMRLGMRINFDEKLELASLELQYTKKEMRKFLNSMKRQINDEIVHLEGYQLDYDDIEKTRTQFEVFIKVAIQLEINQKLPAEKFVKFMRDWLKSGRALLEKLRIQVNNQKIQLRKLREQRDLKQPLHLLVNEVDIFVLNLRLDTVKDDLKLKNSLFLKSKTMLNKASHSIIQMKKTVNEQLKQCTDLEEQTAASKLATKNYIDEEEQLSLEIENMYKKQKMIKDRIKHYQCPSVEEYLMSKHQLRCLKHHLKELKERFNTQEQAIKSYKIVLKTLERKKHEALSEWNWMNISSSNVSVWSSKMILPKFT